MGLIFVGVFVVFAAIGDLKDSQTDWRDDTRIRTIEFEKAVLDESQEEMDRILKSLDK